MRRQPKVSDTLPRCDPRLGRCQRAPRTGYTLLEVIAALAIAALLMSGLYVGLYTQLRFAKSGRDILQRSTSARNLLTRIGNDIVNHLAPTSPWVLKNVPSAAAGSTPSQPAGSGNTSQ